MGTGRPGGLHAGVRTGGGLKAWTMRQTKPYTRTHRAHTWKRKKGPPARMIPSLFVPEVGLEPTRCCQQRILNPSRLPIPPLRQHSIRGRHHGWSRKREDNPAHEFPGHSPAFHKGMTACGKRVSPGALWLIRRSAAEIPQGLRQRTGNAKPVPLRIRGPKRCGRIPAHNRPRHPHRTGKNGGRGSKG